jgi:hypothetical protein
MSFRYTTKHATINFPDTPDARRMAEAISAQHARRAAAHQSIFKSVPQTEPTAYVATPLPSAFDNRHAVHVSMAPRQLFDAPADDPNPIKFVEDSDDCSIEAMNSLALNAMLDGSDQIFQQSSKDVYDAIISTAVVPAEIADQKKNKAVSVHAFVSRVKQIDPQIIFPVEQQGKPLRNIIKTVVSEVKREYRTLNHPLFNAQFTLAVLSQTAHTAKIQAQLHRFMFCQDEADICHFADFCALGKAAPIRIDHSVRVDLLPGFKLFTDDPALMMRLTTALLDYVCYMSNSDIQAVYTDSKTVLGDVLLAAFDRVQGFADAEEIAYNSHSSLAAAAQRSTVDQVDRGIIILGNLSKDLKSRLNKKARKLNVPENCQTRDWVISQLIALEAIDDPDFSWYKKLWRSDKVCRHFKNTGKCPYTNCKFSHEAVGGVADQPAKSAADFLHQAPASMATMLGAATLPARGPEDLTAADVLEVQCRQTVSPGCTPVFKVSPSFWASIKNDKGEPFQPPKSCLSCRKHARANSSSMVTSMLTDMTPEPDGHTPVAPTSDNYHSAMITDCAQADYHADDDYMAQFYEGYDMSMSDMM